MAKILLDSHVWLWMNGAPERLSEWAREQVVDPRNALHLSAASVWEISIKAAAGKLELAGSPERYISERVIENQVEILPIDHRHAMRAATLPLHHRDPFDRMLVAQSQLENLPLLTADRKIALYEVETLAAA